MTALIAIAEYCANPEEGVSAYNVKQSMLSAGFTEAAASVSLRSLLRKKMVEFSWEIDPRDDERFAVYRLTISGEDWLLSNQDKLVLKKPPKNRNTPPSTPDDDLPL
jgi:hypothetical protein